MAVRELDADRPARRRLPAAERERQIVDGAIRYFAEVGFDGQTRELARRLGITQPLLFRYFPTKDDLIDRVYEEVYLRRWRERWTDDLQDRSQPLEDRLVRYYEDYVATIFDDEWIRIFMFAGLKGEALNRRYLELVRERILAVVCAELRETFNLPSADDVPVTVDEVDLAWSLHSAIFYIGVRKWIYRERIPADMPAFIRRNVRTFLGGVAPSLKEILAARS